MVPSAGRQQAEQFVTGVDGVFDDPDGLLLTHSYILNKYYYVYYYMVCMFVCVILISQRLVFPHILLIFGCKV